MAAEVAKMSLCENKERMGVRKQEVSKEEMRGGRQEEGEKQKYSETADALFPL